MNKIKVPSKFIEKDLDKLSQEDINNLFIVADSVNKLNQYVALQRVTKEELIEILKVEVSCDKPSESPKS